MEPQTTTKEEAIAAMTTAAFTINSSESSDYGRTLIHCRMSFTGADWDLADAVALVERSEGIAWTDSMLGHDLAVLADGSIHRFDVKRPAVTTAP